MDMKYDVVIIGGGVSGCAIARELSRYQARILVVDKEEDLCCGTSKANSAIVHAGFDAPHGSLMAKLNVEGSRLMEPLARDLDVPYDRCGSLVVCLAREDLPALEKLYQNGLANGVEGLEILDRETLVKMEPHISPKAVAALWAPTGAILCPFTLTYALGENAAANGTEFRFDTQVTGAEQEGDGWILSTTTGPIAARTVVNGAGVYADVIHNMVADQPMTIIPRRGDYLLLDRTAGNHVSHTIFQLPGKYGKGVLVSPTVHGNLILGPTALDVEDREGVNTTREGLDLVKERSGWAVEDLPLSQTITSFAGLRAHDPRHEFQIGPIAPGFFDCAAIESPGLSSAPAIGRMMAGMVRDHLDLKEKEHFISTRKGILDPARLSFEERQALVMENPAYGRVVCRCETVTEGEILDAIRRTPGARSLDGVKRRTRAGMGRCQGGFCSPRVMELLARELGISLEEVTKSGAGSRLIEGDTKEDWKEGGV